ncbi:4'-phosphopantetheinyl transferase superfamily protein [Alkalihalophilus pseudofirmus]|jgi:phosphopantetheinyl transferase (holo-ACP synthase)|uniref:4'-phosphopantetheinyl transferase superfamily protein n=1 Tax=Alkalihalophilus pseudofirmus TaxID=79885 RepID=A0AAJ2NQ33_ALKPS|nr:4'-phosphopantetheinyl transferase superfamily protein [Alkalihalophilus pseudofirmus]MDV2886398.1 4'-phosphopantetheinyl transferase superfamily protein [Alkalihalophilus pseudofirmus]
MRIIGLGVDIIDRELVLKPHVINHSFSLEEQRYLEASIDKLKDSSIIFAIKEAFMKAASGYVSLGDLKKVNVRANNDAYSILYEEGSFMNDKQCWITTNVFPEYTIASVTIVST